MAEVRRTGLNYINNSLGVGSAVRPQIHAQLEQSITAGLHYFLAQQLFLMSVAFRSKGTKCDPVT